MSTCHKNMFTQVVSRPNSGKDAKQLMIALVGWL